MLDATLTEPEVLPSYEAEAAFVLRGNGWTYNLGGAGNVAEIIGTSGWPETVKPVLVGAVGADEAGARAQELAESVCAPLQPGLMIVGGRATTVKHRVLARGLPRLLPRIDVERTEPLRVDWSWVRAGIAKADSVILSDYEKGFFGEWPENWLDLVPEDVPVIADAKAASVTKFHGATAWCPNGGELAAADADYPLEWPGLADAACAEYGLHFVCVTLGRFGCYLWEKGRGTFLPCSAQRQRLSAIGAGDAFAAGLAVSLALDPDASAEVHAKFAQATAEDYVARGRHVYA